MKIKKILTPIDFSENSMNALKYAIDFAGGSGAAVYVLHMGDPELLANDLKGNLSPEHLLELMKADKMFAGIKVTTIYKKGDVADGILEESRKHDIDLVVMGTQGAGGIARKLVGTNTTRVVGKSQCAVLAVPAQATFSVLKKVVLAVDLEHRTDHLIEELVNTLKVQQAAVELVYVGIDENGHFERDLEELTGSIKKNTNYPLVTGKVLATNDFPAGLENYAKKIEADLIVMITHHHGVLESIFDPSETKLYAYNTTIPMMAVPHHKKPVYFL